MLPTLTAVQIVQKWEGVVTEVGDNTFFADLVTISGEEGDMTAEIYIDKVHEEDRPLVEVGAIFYWSIGQIKDTGETCSIIRFRRLPRWTAAQLKAIHDAAAKGGE